MSKRIPLSQERFAIVDDADFEWLNQWKWTYDRRKHTGYAYRQIYQTSEFVETVRMHQAILNPPLGMETDHINGNGLDNRRCNLRACTQRQNAWNSRKRKGTTSRYKGVSWQRKRQCWAVRIWAHGKNTHLGSFDSEKEAAIAYNYAARKLYGEYARLNPVSDRPPNPGRLKKRPGKTSCYIGVSWSKRYQGWRAEIRVNYKLIYLGLFDSEAEAASVWNSAAVRYRGAKARLNVLQEQEP